MRLKSKLGFFCTLILSLCALSAHADERSDKINAWMKRNGIPGAAVEIYSNGKRTSYYLGYADKENKLPVNENTIFEIASITKIFTTVLFADELMAGAMKLDDPVSNYVPDIPASAKNRLNQITLENLATHTSGLPFNVPRAVNSRKKLANFFTRWKNMSPVGKTWLYSNVNMGLLGFSLEKVTQKSIYQLYDERILKPLGMNSSGAMIPEHLTKYYAQGYKMDGTPAPRRNMKEWLSPPNSDWIFPATGALKSSPHDMFVFLKATLRVPGTPQEIADAMKITQSTYVTTPRFSQGLAWIIHPDPIKNKTKLINMKPKAGPHPATFAGSAGVFNGNALMEKTGASGGFRAYIAVIPNQQTGVVLMVNRYITSAELIRMGRELALT
jgi:beta-lactamase class C